jgi:hypothetical protein
LRWCVAVAAAGLCSFVPLQLLESDEAWLVFAGITLVVMMALVGSLIVTKQVGVALVLVAYGAGAWAIATSWDTHVRESVRWIAGASQLKRVVLARPPGRRGELRHVSRCRSRRFAAGRLACDLARAAAGAAVRGRRCATARAAVVRGDVLHGFRLEPLSRVSGCCSNLGFAAAPRRCPG